MFFLIVQTVAILITGISTSNVDNFLVELSAQGIGYTRTTFNNWASTVTRTSVIVVAPSTKEQIKTLARLVQSYQGDASIGELPLRMRTMGSTHSFSDMYPDENQVLVNLVDYRKNEADRIYHDIPRYSRPYYIVAFNPSVTLQDLLTYLANNGLSLPSLPSTYKTTPIGLVAAGGHGMSWSDGPISSHITAVELITGQGDFRAFDVLQNADVFNLFRYHLGLCGVIIQLTLEVIPYQLMAKYYDVQLPMQNFFNNITNVKAFMTENHSWLGTWNIFSSLSTAEINNMVSNNGITSAWVPKTDMMTSVIHQEVPSGTTVIIQMAEAKTVVDSVFTWSDEYSSNCSLLYGHFPSLTETEIIPSNTFPIQTEFAFSVDENTLSQMTQVVQILQDQIKVYATSHSSLPIQQIQFAFWRHNTTCLLCHSNVADSTVNSHAASGTLIFMVNFQFTTAQKTAFNSLIETIYTAWKSSNYISLPHMGKYVPEGTTIKSDYVTLMKTKIAEFNTLRGSSHIDDIDMFTNEFLDTVVFTETQRVVSALSGSGASDLLPSFMASTLLTFLCIFLIV